MLILLTAWIVHNWWKLLLGIVAIIVILEYHYYKKPAREKKETGKETGDGSLSPGKDPKQEQKPETKEL